MFDLDDIETIEDEAEALENEIRSLQRAINGHAWGMEGSYGRAMMQAIEAGYCILGTTDTHDAYGNHIPSRTQVKLGSKGGTNYARRMQPEFWAYRSEDWAGA